MVVVFVFPVRLAATWAAFLCKWFDKEKRDLNVSGEIAQVMYVQKELDKDNLRAFTYCCHGVQESLDKL